MRRSHDGCTASRTARPTPRSGQKYALTCPQDARSHPSRVTTDRSSWPLLRHRVAPMSSRRDEPCGGSLLDALLSLFQDLESLTISLGSGDHMKHLEDDSREVALEAAKRPRDGSFPRPACAEASSGRRQRASRAGRRWRKRSTPALSASSLAAPHTSPEPLRPFRVRAKNPLWNRRGHDRLVIASGTAGGAVEGDGLSRRLRSRRERLAP